MIAEITYRGAPGRGAPRKALIANPRRFAAAFAHALIMSGVKSERQATLFAAVVFAPEGTLGRVEDCIVAGKWVPVAGTDTGRQLPLKRFNVSGTTGRKSIKVESEARAIRRVLAEIAATPNADVWRDKCARWVIRAIEAKDQTVFDFCAFNLIRLGFDRAAIERIAAAFSAL